MKRGHKPIAERVRLRREFLGLLISGCKADALAIFGESAAEAMRAAADYAQQADDELAHVEAALRGWPVKGR